MRNLLARVPANIGRQLLLNDLVATIKTDFEEYGRVVDEAPAWHDKRVAPTDPDHNTLGPKMPSGSPSGLMKAKLCHARPHASGPKHVWWT